MRFNLTNIMGMRLVIEPRKTGLAFINEIEIPGIPEQTITILFRWAEVLILFVLLGVAIIIIEFRLSIAAWPLFSSWAPTHLEVFATAVTALAFLVGIVFATWKRRQLFTYGIAEIAFGSLSVLEIMLHLWPEVNFSKFVGLGSALYVISRGAGNLGDAFLQETGFDRITIRKIAADERLIRELINAMVDEQDRTKLIKLKLQLDEAMRSKEQRLASAIQNKE